MPKLPDPPPLAVLAAITPDLRLLPAGTRLWRVHFQGGDYPSAWNAFRSFGPVATARFDHHLDGPAGPMTQPRQILYSAINGKTCVAEAFPATRTIDTTKRDPWLAGFELIQDLLLLDLTGTWPTAAGASSAINSGPRPRARRWSQAIHGAYPMVHGLWYRSSMYGNSPAIALYERAAIAIPPQPFFHRPLHHPALYTMLHRLASEIRYRLIVRWFPP